MMNFLVRVENGVVQTHFTANSEVRLYQNPLPLDHKPLRHRPKSQTVSEGGRAKRNLTKRASGRRQAVFAARHCLFGRRLGLFVAAR
jgi:hypothetical protein